SLGHVAIRPDGHRFEFAPAGLPADSEMVLTHRRWHRLLTELHSMSTLMLGYVPVEAPGLSELTQRITRVLVLAVGNDLDEASARLGSHVDCLAVLSPAAPAPVIPEPDPVSELIPELPAPGTANGQPASHSESTRAATTSPGLEAMARTPEQNGPPESASIHRRSPDQDFEAIRIPRQGARETLIADMRARQRAARQPPAHPPVLPSESAHGTAEAAPPPARVPPAQLQPPLSEPTFVAVQPRADVKSRRGLYVAVSLTLLAMLALAAWIVYDRFLRPVATEWQTLPPTLVSPPPVVPSRIVPLPYSVAVEAHQELSLANERVGALRAEEPSLGFYVAPALVDSVLYYRVMAGPVADSVEASLLLRRLLERGHKTGATQWDVRQWPLAFALGDHEALGEAQAREREIAARSIPTYVIEVQGLDGRTRFRVYAGAYAGFAEAELMRRMLRNEGLPDSLVQRVGVRR
ncbi:MAG: SPOR domain-containing protein, partial [Longimicrobiales bacterium]